MVGKISDFTVTGVAPAMKGADEMFTVDLPLTQLGSHVRAIRIEGVDATTGTKENDLSTPHRGRFDLTLADVGACPCEIPGSQIAGDLPRQTVLGLPGQTSRLCDVQGKTR